MVVGVDREKDESNLKGLTFVNVASAAGGPCSALTIQYTNQHTILYNTMYLLPSFLPSLTPSYY